MTKNFSNKSTKRSGGNRYQPKTQAIAIAAVDRTISEFHVKIIEASRKWVLTHAQKSQLRFLTGTRKIGKWPLLSDLPARRKASRILIKLMSQHRRKRSKIHASIYYFLTFIDDEGNTSDRDPQVNIGAIQRKVDKAMRKLGLSGVAVTEVQALMNYPGRGAGRTLMYHTHCIAWTSDPSFNCTAAQARINTSRSWHNSFGAPPLKIACTTDSEGQIDWLSYYVLKVPYDVKNRVPKRKKLGAHMLMQTTTGYRPELAFRIFEGLSQIELPTVLFGIGEGAQIRKKWRHKLLKWHQSRPTAPATFLPLDIPAFWQAVRSNNGSKLFAPYQFLTGRSRSATVHLPPDEDSC